MLLAYGGWGHTMPIVDLRVFNLVLDRPVGHQEGFKRHIEKKEDFQIGFGGKLIRICLLSLLSSLKVELFCIKSWFTIF